MKSLAVLGTAVVMGFGFAACRSSSSGGGTGGSGTGGSGTGGTAGTGGSGTGGTGGTGATAGTGGSGTGGTGATAGTGGSGGKDAGVCTPGTAASINDIDTGKVGIGQYVQLTDVVATSQKFLTYKSKTKGSCLWAVFATDGGQTTEGESTSIMIVSYGDNAVTTDAGTAGPCKTGTDAIPDDVKPGDKLDIMAGKTDQYAPSTCTGGTVGAMQLSVLPKCPITKNGTATPPAPYVLDTTTANAIAAGTDATTLAKWGGALVELDGAVSVAGDGGSPIGNYGDISFSNYDLMAADTIFYKDVTDPGNSANAWQYASAPTFSKIVGLIYLNYCTYEIAPRDKCTDVTPKSDDCP
jgi:hypothetical protein